MKHKRTTTRPAQIVTAGLAIIALSGCAELGSIGKYAWQQTETAAEFLYKPVASLLRETPEQAYAFDDSTDQTVTDYNVKVFQEPASQETYAFLEQNDTSHQSFNTEMYSGEAFDTQTVYAESIDMGYDTASNDFNDFGSDDSLDVSDISFIKIGGGSDMQDWMNCEAEVGGYMSWENGENVVSQDFEICMRMNGYILEKDLDKQKTL